MTDYRYMIDRLDIDCQRCLNFSMAKIKFKMNKMHDISGKLIKLLGPQFLHF